MRKIIEPLAIVLALATPVAAQEGNPCQVALTTAQTDPNQIAFHIEDLDRLGVTTVEYVVFTGDGQEPQDRQKIPRHQLQTTPFINCYTLPYTPTANLARDGKTQHFIVARTEDARMRVSAWSVKSNPFTLGAVTPPPDPPPLPVPGVRVGRIGG